MRLLRLFQLLYVWAMMNKPMWFGSKCTKITFGGVIDAECVCGHARRPAACCLSLWVNMTIPVDRVVLSTPPLRFGMAARGANVCGCVYFWSQDNSCFLYDIHASAFVNVCFFMCQWAQGYNLSPCYFLHSTNQLAALHYTEMFYKCCVWPVFYLFFSWESWKTGLIRTNSST